VVAIARQRLRRRPAATAFLLLLTGVSAAVPMALWAASRSTATAMDRFVDQADVADTQLYACPPDHDPAEGDPTPCFQTRAEDLEVIRSTPGVTAVAAVDFHPVAVTTDRTDTGSLPARVSIVTLGEGGARPTVLGDPIILDGRLASTRAPDEVMVTEPAAKSLGVGVSDRVRFSNSPSDPADEPVEGEVVGVIRTPADFLPIALESIAGPGFFVRPGWVEAHGAELERYSTIGVWLADGDVDTFVERLGPRFEGRVLAADPVIPVGEVGTIEHATSLESRAGVALAVTAALAVAFFVGQAVSRQSRAEAADDGALSALGLTRRQLAAVPAVRWLPVAIGGTLLAVVLAWAAAALGPIGVARRAVWERSPAADWPVLAVGAGVTLALVLLVPVLVGLRRPRGDERSGAAAQAASVGPPGLRAGIGLARESVRRGSALPLVSAVAATAVAVAAIVTAAAGAATLRRVTDEPRRFGAPWDAMVSGGGGFESPEEAGRTLSALPGIVSVAGIAGTDVAIRGDRQVWVQALLPVGDLPPSAPVIVSGRAPANDGEVALGSVTMEDSGARVGDEVEVEVPTAAEPLTFEVVGEAMVTDGFEPNVGDGGLVTPDGLDRIDESAKEDLELGIELVDGPGREEALARLRRTVAGTIAPFPVPATLANAERITGLPLLLAAGGAVLAAITFVHALVTSVRRNRRQLAVCRVLGFTGRQVHGAVATQATMLALAAVGIGVPLGIICAQWGWRVMARAFGVASGALVPAWVALLAAIAVVVVANLAAAPPSRWATRGRPAEALRSE
jgi:hypothetical protein